MKAVAVCVCIAAVAAVGASGAKASPGGTQTPLAGGAASRPVLASPPARDGGRAAASARSDRGGISCVPFARSVTGMQISGNGRDWWHNAAGRYARGHRPEPGSVLAFPASGNMRAGHVAVVSRVIHNRMIEIDHANWAGPGIRRGTVMRGVRVIDVSDDNSWTRVRVQVGWDSQNFGREYPTYGFIHNRPASAFAAGEDFVRPVSAVTTTRAARPSQGAEAPRATRPSRAEQAPRPVQAARPAQAPRGPQAGQAPRPAVAPVAAAR